MAITQLTDENLITSLGRMLAEKFTESGWLVHWQATDVDSGTATYGEVTLVPEFPDDPSLMVLPQSPIQSRTAEEVILPAFAVSVLIEPFEQQRAGLGDSEFEWMASFGIDGFVTDQSEHMAFATMFRDWFKEDTRILIFDYESSPVNPDLIDTDVIVERRVVDRLRSIDPNVPRPNRYYISVQIDVSFYD